jgi:hypothetical protein
MCFLWGTNWVFISQTAEFFNFNKLSDCSFFIYDTAQWSLVDSCFHKLSATAVLSQNRCYKLRLFFGIISHIIVRNVCGDKCVMACAFRGFAETSKCASYHVERHLPCCYTTGIIMPRSISDVKLRGRKFKALFLFIVSLLCAALVGRSVEIMVDLPTSYTDVFRMKSQH